ncbi:uncharacterized protein [Dysidea avara]|uniref:uncharacterized protein n=1 Tax=Dysidea avara TaxID=196820 RepID=UPI0033332ADC
MLSIPSNRDIIVSAGLLITASTVRGNFLNDIDADGVLSSQWSLIALAVVLLLFVLTLCCCCYLMLVVLRQRKRRLRREVQRQSPLQKCKSYDEKNKQFSQEMPANNKVLLKQKSMTTLSVASIHSNDVSEDLAGNQPSTSISQNDTTVKMRPFLVCSDVLQTDNAIKVPSHANVTIDTNFSKETVVEMHTLLADTFQTKTATKAHDSVSVSVQNSLPLETTFGHAVVTMHSSHSGRLHRNVTLPSEHEVTATSSTDTTNNVQPSSPPVNNTLTDVSRSGSIPPAEKHVVCTTSMITNSSGSTDIPGSQNRDDCNMISTTVVSKMQDNDTSIETSCLESHFAPDDPVCKVVKLQECTPVTPLSVDNPNNASDHEGNLETITELDYKKTNSLLVVRGTDQMNTPILNGKETSGINVDSEHKAAIEMSLTSINPLGSGDAQGNEVPSSVTNTHKPSLEEESALEEKSSLEEENTMTHSIATNKLDIHNLNSGKEKSGNPFGKLGRGLDEIQESSSFLCINITPDDESREEIPVSEPEDTDIVLEVQSPLIVSSDIATNHDDITVELGDKSEAATDVSCSGDLQNVDNDLNQSTQPSVLLPTVNTTLQLPQHHDVNDTHSVNGTTDDSFDGQGSVTTHAPNHGSENTNKQISDEVEVTTQAPILADTSFEISAPSSVNDCDLSDSCNGLGMLLPVEKLGSNNGLSKKIANKVEVTLQSSTLAYDSTEVSTCSAAKDCDLSIVAPSELQENFIVTNTSNMDDDCTTNNISPSKEWSNDAAEEQSIPTVTDILNNLLQALNETEAITILNDEEAFSMHSTFITNDNASNGIDDDHTSNAEVFSVDAEMQSFVTTTNIFNNPPGSSKETDSITTPNDNETYSKHSAIIANNIAAMSSGMDDECKTNTETLPDDAEVQLFPTITDKPPQSSNEAESITTSSDKETFSTHSVMPDEMNKPTIPVRKRKKKTSAYNRASHSLHSCQEGLPHDDAEMRNTEMYTASVIGISRKQLHNLVPHHDKEIGTPSMPNVSVTFSENNLTATTVTSSAHFTLYPNKASGSKDEYSRSGGTATNHAAAVKMQRNPAYVTVSYAAHTGAHEYECIPLVLEETKQPTTTASNIAVKMERNPAYVTVSYSQSRHSRHHK